MKSSPLPPHGRGRGRVLPPFGPALAFLLAACNGGPPPSPHPSPTPWECPLEMPGCHETGQTCSEPPDARCWHNPTNDPEHCEEAPLCEPEPEPTPGPCIVEAELEPATCSGQEYRDRIKTATLRLGDLTGRDPQANLTLLAETLGNEGLCAVAGAEAVFILRSDGLAEENHAVYFGDGGWTGNGFGKFIGCHGGVPPVQCGEPDPLGLPGQFNLKKHHQDWDRTYLVYRQYDYCVEAGFIDRATCPVRLEGNYQREACEERVGAGSRGKWWCDGEPIEPHENPAQARCIGHVRTCTADGATCAERNW